MNHRIYIAKLYLVKHWIDTMIQKQIGLTASQKLMIHVIKWYLFLDMFQNIKRFQTECLTTPI